MTTTSATTSTSTAATTTTSTSATKSSLGAGIVNSLDAGSGIDTDSLITKLTDAQKASLQTPITIKQTANAAQVSAAANLASYMSTFSSSLDTLVSGGTLMTQPNSSNTSVLAATAQSGARIGNLSASVTVNQLAKGQTLSSAGVAAGTGFSTGTLSFAIAGGGSVTLTAGTDFTDVSTLATAINAKSGGSGLSASVTTDAQGQHLVVRGATGTSRAFTVSASDPSLAAFAYDGSAGGTGATQLQAAQDASISVDGATFTSGSNSVTTAIPGVTLTLAGTGSSTLTSTRPTSAITQAVSDFVTAYNAMKGEIDAATAAATSSTDAGALRGNQTVRDMQRQLAKLTTTPLIASGSITTLAQLGVKTGQDGTLSVDTTTLNAMVAAYPDDVEAMFNPAQTSSNGNVTITSKIGKVAAGSYALTGLSYSGSGAASGSVDGAAMAGSGKVLVAPAGTAAAGLTVLLGGTTSGGSATIKVDLGLAGALAMIKDSLTGTAGSLTVLQSRLKTQSSTLADQLAKTDTALTVYHDRLVSQFSSMNTRVSAYKATQSYLTQQVDLWTKSSN